MPCPSCGHYQVLRWENLRWDKVSDGTHLPETAHFVCERNGCVITEDKKPGMIAAGKWVAERPFTGHASYHLWTAYSLFPNASWSNIAREFLVAHKDATLLRTFTNTTLGQVFEERGTGRPWEELAARARQSDYERGLVPKGCLLLFLGLDCQLGHVEWVLLGFGPEYRKFVVDYGTIGRPIGEADAQRHLDQLLSRTWPNAFGRQIPISLAAIDAGFETDTVLEFCRRHGPARLIAIRGVAGDFTPRIAKVQRERSAKTGTVLKYARNFFNIGVSQFKLQLYRDLEKDDPNAAGYVAFPNNCEDRFFQELVSKSRVPVKRMGQTTWVWTKPDRQRNEILDCTVYACAASIKYGIAWISYIGWQKLREQRETPPDDKPQQVIGPVTAAQQAEMTRKPSLASRLAR